MRRYQVGPSLHRIIAERALGRPLKTTEHVHHHDAVQLVICQDSAYHNFLERRTRAFRATGHADWRRCRICLQWDAPEFLKIWSRKSGQVGAEIVVHAACNNKMSRDYRSDVKGCQST